MTSDQRSRPGSRDFLGNPLSALLWWGLPLAIAWSAEVLPVGHTAETLVWAGALAWMGVGCTLNALRCGRLHCYAAAPVLLLGALGATLVALGWAPLGPHSGGYVINGALGLAVLTLLAELVGELSRSAANSNR